MEIYNHIVREVLYEGKNRQNRTGTDAVSLFNLNYEVDLREGFPILTTKKVSWKNIVVELLWFLSGESHTGFLKKHGCKFWDPWTDQTGRVPSAYGKYWRAFPSSEGKMDQLWYAIEKLKLNPDDRRAVVSAWEPGNAIISDLPPCHAFFVLNMWDGALNLHLTQRSCDIGLGLPYNMASYALLMHLLANMIGVEAGLFAHSIVDAHIYTNHEKALLEQISRKPYNLPNLVFPKEIKNLQDLTPFYSLSTKDLMDKFYLLDYQAHPNVQLDPAV